MRLPPFVLFILRKKYDIVLFNLIVRSFSWICGKYLINTFFRIWTNIWQGSLMVHQPAFCWDPKYFEIPYKNIWLINNSMVSQCTIIQWRLHKYVLRDKQIFANFLLRLGESWSRKFGRWAGSAFSWYLNGLALHKQKRH